MNLKFIYFISSVVAFVIAIMAFAHIYPHFGLWLEKNPLWVVVTFVAIGVLGWFLLREPRPARTTTATTATTTAAPTPARTRRPFPLSWGGVIALLACIAIVIWVLVDDRIPDYLLFHIATLVLIGRYIAIATGPVTGEMLRLITGILLLTFSVILVFTKINMEPEWLFGILTGGIPFLIMLIVVLTPTMSIAGRRIACAVIEATICFTLVYFIAALFKLSVDHRLAYALFLSPVLFAISTLFPTITLTRGQRWWMIGLGVGIAALYTLVMFGMPRMNIPTPSGLTWKIAVLVLTLIAVALLSNWRPLRNLNFFHQGLIVALVAILLFPELIDVLKRVFSWLPLIVALALVTWLWAVDDIHKVVKAIGTIVILIVIWPKHADKVWHWLLNAGENIKAIDFTLSGNAWWIILILLVLLVGWASWAFIGSKFGTVALILATIVLYSLATNRLSARTLQPIRHNNPPTTSPAPTTTAPAKKGSKGKSIWDKYPDRKTPVNDSLTIHR